jgi:hypothetical protein
VTNGEIIEMLEEIVAVDRTPFYDIGQPRDWDGKFPLGGGSWPTPRRLAQDALKRIRTENSLQTH